MTEEKKEEPKKEEPIISWKDGLLLVGLGVVSVWLLLKGEREKPEVKPDEKKVE